MHGRGKTCWARPERSGPRASSGGDAYTPAVSAPLAATCRAGAAVLQHQFAGGTMRSARRRYGGGVPPPPGSRSRLRPSPSPGRKWPSWPIALELNFLGLQRDRQPPKAGLHQPGPGRRPIPAEWRHIATRKSWHQPQRHPLSAWALAMPGSPRSLPGCRLCKIGSIGASRCRGVESTAPGGPPGQGLLMQRD